MMCSWPAFATGEMHTDNAGQRRPGPGTAGFQLIFSTDAIHRYLATMAKMTPGEEQAVSATEARSKLSDLISQAQYSEERTILTRHDKPVAALVSMEDLKALRKLEDATDVARARESIEDARKHGGTKPLEEFRKELEARRDE
jgi:prevent-host-death family protein